MDGFDALSINSAYMEAWPPSPAVTRQTSTPPPMIPLPTPPRLSLTPIMTNFNTPTITIMRAETLEEPERTTKEVRFLDEGKFECESPIIPPMFKGLTPPGSPGRPDISIDACVQELRAGGSWCSEPSPGESLNLDRMLWC